MIEVTVKKMNILKAQTMQLASSGRAASSSATTSGPYVVVVVVHPRVDAPTLC
jgi:hypothetical protein